MARMDPLYNPEKIIRPSGQRIDYPFGHILLRPNMCPGAIQLMLL
jgi:hypothetical protein